MANSLSAANHNNQMIFLINPFSNHQLDDVNLFTGNCTKCRSCFMNLSECQNQACVAIDSSHRQTFFTLTGVELSSTPKSVDFLCLNCANMLKVFSEMGKAAADLQNRYVEFMQNRIDIVKVEPEEVVSVEVENDFSGDDDSQIYPYEGDASEIESCEHSAVENMQECSVQLTKLSAETIAQYSTEEETQTSNELKCAIDGCNKICKNMISLRDHRYQFHRQHSQDKTTCHVCEKICLNKRAFWNHQKIHKMKLACDICGKECKEKYQLIDHMCTYHINNSKFNCSKCLKICKSQIKLKVHQRNTHNAKKFKCDMCNAAFYAPSRLAEHVKVKHEGRRFHCSYPGCTENFLWKIIAARHLRQIHELIGIEYKKHHKLITIS